MRVLLTCYQEKTFFFHMVPLAWALRTAGHEVRVATQPGFASVVMAAGLTAVPVGSARDFWRITSSDSRRIAAMRAGIMAPYDAYDDPAKSTWDYLRPGVADAVWSWHRTQNFPVISELVDLARRWEPDLVVWEPLAFAGAIAAKACGAAHARMLWSIDIFGAVRERYLSLNRSQPVGEQTDPFADWMSGYGTRFGFEFDDAMVTGHFTIDHLPASLQNRVESLDYLSMRYVPYGGRATVPSWLRVRPDRPRVAVTLGVSATEIFDGFHLSPAVVLDALRDLDVDVVATVPDRYRDRLGHVPDNARVVPYVPLHSLAATCSAAIHHGGHGTMSTFATHGVPQLIVPFHFDEPIFAAKLAERGAGLTLDGSGDDLAGDIRDAVSRALSDPELLAGAADVRAEMSATPSPNEVVGDLVDLTMKHRTG